MKKILFMTFLAFSVPVMAQEKVIKYPDGRVAIVSSDGVQLCDKNGNCQFVDKDTFPELNQGISVKSLGDPLDNRVDMFGQSADFKHSTLNDNHIKYDVTNPNGTEQATLDMYHHGKNEGTITVRDAKTGQIVTAGAAKKNNDSFYLNKTTNLPGQKGNLLYDVKGNEGNETGTFMVSSDNLNANMQLNQGRPTGTVRQVLENGYERLITLYSNGSMNVLINDPKTHKTLYKAQGTEDNMKLYDSKGKLIAEGSDDHMKVYDQAAYKQYEKIADDD